MIRYRFNVLLGLLSVALVAGLAWLSCTGDRSLTAPRNHQPSLSFQGEQQDLGPAFAAKARHTERLLAIPGVVGTAVGLTRDGRPAVKIFTARQTAGLPQNLDGVPVVVEMTGEIVALSLDRSSGALAVVTPGTDEYSHPVPIGVSTGNATATSNCATGTIAARLFDGTNYYALSNNHVYALTNTASIGSQVVQPGLIDDDCPVGGIFDSDNDALATDVIGTLRAFKAISFKRRTTNVIDAAIALSSIARLTNTTPVGGYGTPSSTTAPAFVGQAVQKYGRTTLLTTGAVSAVDGTVLVSYGSGKTAQFVHQIFVTSGGQFIGAGDSGSLLVNADAGLNPNPVGLLFAGNSSGTMAVANPIDAVLAYFSSVVGAAVIIQ